MFEPTPDFIEDERPAANRFPLKRRMRVLLQDGAKAAAAGVNEGRQVSA